MLDGGAAVGMVQSGKVKAIAVCTSKHARLPGMQSYEKLGVADASKSRGQFRWAVYAPLLPAAADAAQAGHNNLCAASPPPSPD